MWKRIWMVILVCACVAGGCGEGAPAQKPLEKVVVVASVYPLAEVVRQVGGDHVDVSWVVEHGESLSGFVPSSEFRHRLRVADLVVCGGATEPWATEGFGDPFQVQRIIRLDALGTTAPGPAQSGCVWLDPLIVKDAARELSVRLEALRPQVDKTFRDNADRFIAQIDALVKEYEPKFANVQTRKVLVLGSEFDPLLGRAGILPIMTIEKSPMRIDESDLRIIMRLARENNTRLLLVPSDTPAAVVQDLQVRGGLQLIPLDYLGTSAPSGRNTYLKMIRYDMEQLYAATTVR